MNEGKTKSKKPAEEVAINDTTLSGMIKRRAANAEAHWEKKYNLKRTREDNFKLYDSSYLLDRLIDERYEEIFSDNRLFTAVRTLVSFSTSRLTQPETIPADGDPSAIEFARNFEKILVKAANKAKARQKIKLALQDLLTGQRIGILQWVYNNERDCIDLEYLSPDSVILDHTVKYMEEPRFVQITRERTIEQLIGQFPDKKDALFKKLGIEKGVPSQLELQKKITENWLYDTTGDKPGYIIVWMYDDLVLGKIRDPLWMTNRPNLLEWPMTPFVFFNLLNDGKGLIDHTSYIEQAQYNQKNYDKLGKRIVEDASYGGIGVPVFAKGAIDQGEAAKVKFNPTQRIILDMEDVSKAFTTWQSGGMPTFIPAEKQDSRDNVDNVFGTPNIMRGQDSDAKTLGENIIVRDQAEGRHSDLIDSIDDSLSRFFQLEGQFIYRYYDEDKYFNALGDDGQFTRLVISQERIAKNIDMAIEVKAGTSMPIDKAQRRATVLKIADRLPTLTLYRELGIDDPEGVYKLYLLENNDPQAALSDTEKYIYDEEAEEDLQVVLAGEVPEDRDDITESYIKHLNEFLLTDKFVKLDEETQANVSAFVDLVIAKAQRKAEKLATQVPVDDQAMPTVSPDGMTAEQMTGMMPGTGQPQQPGGSLAPPPPTQPANTPTQSDIAPVV